MKTKKTLTIISIILIFFSLVAASVQYQSYIPFARRAALGTLNGVYVVEKFGDNPTLDVGVAETIWEGQGLYPWDAFASGAQVLEAVSASASDTLAGTGARTVRVEGLGSNYELQNENVTLNGTTAATLSLPFIRVFRIRVITAGSSGTNAGVITIRLSGGGVTVGTVSAGENQSQMGIYTIPANKTGLIVQFQSALSKKQSTIVEAEIYVRSFGEVFQEKLKHRLGATSGSQETTTFVGGILVPEKSDIDIRGESDSITTAIGTSFEILVFDN